MSRSRRATLRARAAEAGDVVVPRAQQAYETLAPKAQQAYETLAPKVGAAASRVGPAVVAGVEAAQPYARRAAEAAEPYVERARTRVQPVLQPVLDEAQTRFGPAAEQAAELTRTKVVPAVGGAVETVRTTVIPKVSAGVAAAAAASAPVAAEARLRGQAAMTALAGHQQAVAVVKRRRPRRWSLVLALFVGAAAGAVAAEAVRRLRGGGQDFAAPAPAPLFRQDTPGAAAPAAGMAGAPSEPTVTEETAVVVETFTGEGAPTVEPPQDGGLPLDAEGVGTAEGNPIAGLEQRGEVEPPETPPAP